MVKARADREVRLCEECGQPIEARGTHLFLCRRCEQMLEHSKRKGQQVRQIRRNSRREDFEDDW